MKHKGLLTAMLAIIIGAGIVSTVLVSDAMSGPGTLHVTAQAADPSFAPSGEILSVQQIKQGDVLMGVLANFRGCPNGQVISEIHWRWDDAALSCDGIIVIHGVTVDYTRNSDGTSLTTWTYQGRSGDMGYDIGQDDGETHLAPGFFSDVDAE